MSTPDARLNAAERAALADLEASAAAADPSLAARLGAGSAWWARSWFDIAVTRAGAAWGWLLKLQWWGVPMVVAGLFLAALGLSTGLALSVFGAVMVAVGLRVIAEMLVSRRSG